MAVATAFALFGACAPASAQNATWNGATANWETDGNWTPATVPTATATFDTTGLATVNISDNRSIGEVRFLATANAFTFDVSGSLTVQGTGLINNSANTQTFNVAGALILTGNATTTNVTIVNDGAGPNGIFFFGTSATTFTSAGNADITNNGNINFFGFSSAGTATITNSATGAIQFLGDSTASGSDITNDGSLSFAFNSTAGNATIENNNTMSFNGNSNAGVNANITNNLGAFLDFFQFSNAGSSTFANDGAMQFNDNSSAANATITNTGTLNFNGNATAGNATIVNDILGDINFNDSSTAGNSRITNNGFLSFNDNSSAGNARITNDCCLEFNDNSSAGNARITNTVNGLITFSDNSTAGNAIITNRGIIFFEGDSTAGSARITIAQNAGLGFDDNASAGNATIINNSDAFPGGLIFAGFSTAANATITTSNGAYTFFVDGSTGGDARFIVNGTGVLDFSGSIGPALNFRMTAGSFEGDGTIIISGTMSVGSNNRSTEFSGQITDNCLCGLPGNLVKVGTGTLTLSGVSDYTGFTEVRGGTLLITGSIASNTTVFANAILGGTGTIFGNLTVNANGILAPGTSIGTMRIAGNATFNANSIYRVEVGTTTADRTNVTGNLQINGGIVQVLNTGGSLGAGRSFTILTGTRTGTFNGVTDDYAFYDSTLTYTGTSVILNLTRNASFFADFALTPNQIAVAGALDAANANTALLAFLLGLSEAQLRAAYDLLSGELHATMAGAFFDESNLLRNAIFGRLRNTAFSGFGGTLGFLSEQNEEALAYARTSRNSPFGALRPVDRSYEFWTQAFGSWSRQDSDGNAADARRNTGGFIAGLDRMLQDGVRAGLAAGFSTTNVTVPARQSKAQADTFHLAAYLSKLDGRWSYRAGASASIHGVDADRTALGATLRSDYVAFTGQIFGEIARAYAWQQIALEPFANIAVLYNHIGSFTETGGLGALTSNGSDNFIGYTTLGLRFATQYRMQNGALLIPRGMVAWQHAIGSLAPEATLTFQNTGTSFTVAGTPLARHTLLAEGGFDIRVAPNTLLGFTYAAALAEDVQSHTVRGKLERRF